MMTIDDLKSLKERIESLGYEYIISDNEGLIINEGINDPIYNKIPLLLSCIDRNLKSVLGALIPTFYIIKLNNKKVYVLKKDQLMIYIFEKKN